MLPGFLTPLLPRAAARARPARQRHTPTCSNAGAGASKSRVRLSPRGLAFASCGAATLSLALANRILLTGLDVSPFQARADILGVVCGVSLLLYGAGSAEVAEKGRAVSLQGTQVGFETTLLGAAAAEARFVVDAALAAVPNFVAAAVFLDGQCVARSGLFRTAGMMEGVAAGALVQGAVTKGEIAYLADLRVVPTKEIEFPFLPEDCQVRRRSCSTNAHVLQKLTFIYSNATGGRDRAHKWAWRGRVRRGQSAAAERGRLWLAHRALRQVRRSSTVTDSICSLINEARTRKSELKFAKQRRCEEIPSVERW